jgi:hypothetical protein
MRISDEDTGGGYRREKKRGKIIRQNLGRRIGYMNREGRIRGGGTRGDRQRNAGTVYCQ